MRTYENRKTYTEKKYSPTEAYKELSYIFSKTRLTENVSLEPDLVSSILRHLKQYSLEVEAAN